MTAKKNSRPTAVSSLQQGVMSRPGESAWTGAMTMIPTDEDSTSRERQIEARGHLLRMEREFIDLSAEAEKSALQEVEALERRTAEIKAETWAIEQETETRVSVLRKQARMESDLADRVRDIAERSALSILDRIKEASDSMMNWANLYGEDMAQMMKQEAAEQVARKMGDIEAAEMAMEDESRAVELLELATRYRGQSAA